MHTFIAIDQIKARAEAIGLTLSGLAVKAGLRPSTVLRISKGETHAGWISTNEKLVNTLTAEECRVRDHLASLQPQQDRETNDAA